MGQSPSSKNYSKNSNDTILIQGNADLIRGKIVPRIYTSEITKLSYPGDIILTVRAPVGDLAINEFDSCIGRGVCSIKGNKFIYYYLESLKDKHVWERLSQGSTFESINSNDIKNLNLKIPSNSTQNHIINFLTAIDTKIELLQKKHSEYLRFKQYLMQNIFADKSAEKLRFDNFENEWEYKKLGQVSIVKDGTHDSPKYVSDGYPLITSKNLLNGEIDFKNVNYISKEDYDAINKRSNVDKGDILFGMIGTIGNPLIVETDDFAIKNVALIKEKEGLLNKFLIYVLETDFINKQFYRLNAGGTQKFIALGLIKDLLVPIPSIKEQLKISEFLSIVDINLNSYKNQISNMKKFKKGLLQQMFI